MLFLSINIHLFVIFFIALIHYTINRQMLRSSCAMQSRSIAIQLCHAVPLHCDHAEEMKSRPMFEFRLAPIDFQAERTGFFLTFCIISSDRIRTGGSFCYLIFKICCDLCRIGLWTTPSVFCLVEMVLRVRIARSSSYWRITSGISFRMFWSSRCLSFTRSDIVHQMALT